MRKSTLISCAITLMFMMTGIIFAEVPLLISYQGKLKDSYGNPVNATVPMTFTIYDHPTADTDVWSETQPSVTVTDGLFTVMLGSEYIIGDDVFDGADRWLGIQVESEPELSPRTRIASVGYAYKVGSVDGASGGTITDDLNVTRFLVVNHAIITDSLFVNKIARIGQDNTLSGEASFVVGQNNTVAADFNTITGGQYNSIEGPGYNTIGGGFGNSIDIGSVYSTIGGGENNELNGYHSSISGGWGNSLDGSDGTIGGGRLNIIDGNYCVIGGGSYNFASGLFGVVSGGNDNNNWGNYSVIPGGKEVDITVDSDYSFGFGNNITVDAASYVIFFDEDNPGHLQLNRDHDVGLPTGYPIRVGMDASTGNGAYLTGGGVWTDYTPLTMRTEFQIFEGNDVLNKIEEVQIAKWKCENSNEQHIGPLAEDFNNAFDCGSKKAEDDGSYVAASDIAGVALAGVKELIKIIEGQNKKITQLENKLIELEAKN